MIVRHCKGEGVGQALAHAQALHCGQAVVQGIGIVARSIHAERAVTARRIGLWNETDHIVQIRIDRDRQRTADAGRILVNGSRGRRNSGRVVTAVDAHGDHRGRRTTVIVRDRNSKTVSQAFARAQALYCGQRSIQHICIIAVGVHAEGAVIARGIGQRRETDRIMHIHIRGHGQRAGGDGAVFGDVHGSGGQHRRVIAAVDGHGQGIGGRAAMPVGGCEGEGLGQAFAHAQALYCGQAVVQGIGIVARSIQCERAVQARRVCLGNERRNIMQIRINRRGQRAADAGRILNNRSRGCGDHRRVVTAVDSHGQGVGGRAAAPVGYREGEGLGQAFARAQALHRGQAVIQGIGIVARGIHAECAVEPGGARLRNERHNVMRVRVPRRGQHPCDAGRILANGSQSGSHGGRVIAAAVDAHGDYRGR